MWRSPLRILEYFSPGSLIVIAITFVLFTLALFSHGFTHDLLLEAGVFLVSVKLMFMTYRSSRVARSLEAKLDRICDALQETKGKRHKKGKG